MEQLKEIDRRDFHRRYIKNMVSREEIDEVMALAAAGLREIGPAAYQPDSRSWDSWNVVVALLSTLRYANDTSYKDLIASFLHGRSVQAAIEALSTLCVFYQLTPEYATEIAELIRGVPWDEFNSVQDRAAGEAASYLKDHAQPVLLRALVETADDETPGGEPGSLEARFKEERRIGTYGALEYAMGVVRSRDEVEHIPFKPGLDALDIPIDPSIIEAAKQRLMREEAQSSHSSGEGSS